MSEENSPLKIYADKECTQPISAIEWNNQTIITLVSGEKVVLPNTSKGGENATATFYIKNEKDYDYGITGISFTDNRVKVNVSSAWIRAKQVVQMTLIFYVPPNPTEEDIIDAGNIKITGYFIYYK